MSGARRPYGVAEVPAPTGSESAAFDRWAIDEVGVPQAVLMENAGRAAAAVVSQLFPSERVVALVGTGNNGGDALVALRTLAAAGRDVEAVYVGDREDDGLLHGWPVRATPASDLDDAGWTRILAGAPVLLDGLLGTGLTGAAREPHASVIRRANGSRGWIVAMDVPSGVDADDGRVLGAAIRADATVCFGHPKLGVLLNPARVCAGRILAVEIGFPPAERGHFGAEVLTPAWVDGRRPTRAVDTHKNEVGAVAVVAGHEGMAGAAVLATRAALRGGAGLVRIVTPGANRRILQSAVPEAICVDAGADADVRRAIEASAAVAAGPGMGTSREAEALLATVLGSVGSRPLLLDADALNLLAAERPTPLRAVCDGRDVLVTPHPGEMSRLVGTSVSEVRERRVEVATTFAAEHRCALVLKGAPTLVVTPGDPLLVTSAGTSALATGGMGDVLSGLAGALLARGLSPRDAAGVALHTSGRAALLAEADEGLTPSDVIERLPEAWKERGPGDTEVRLTGLLFDQDRAT